MSNTLQVRVGWISHLSNCHKPRETDGRLTRKQAVALIKYLHFKAEQNIIKRAALKRFPSEEKRSVYSVMVYLCKEGKCGNP